MLGNDEGGWELECKTHLALRSKRQQKGGNTEQIYKYRRIGLHGKEYTGSICFFLSEIFGIAYTHY